MASGMQREIIKTIRHVRYTDILITGSPVSMDLCERKAATSYLDSKDIASVNKNHTRKTTKSHTNYKTKIKS